MFGSSTSVVSDAGEESGSGDWCNNDPNTPFASQCLPGSPGPVPEPATLPILGSVVLFVIMAHAGRFWRRSTPPMEWRAGR